MDDKIINFTINEFWSGWDLASLLVAGAAIVILGLGFIFLIFILCKGLRRNQWLKTFQHWIKNTWWIPKLRFHRKSCPTVNKEIETISNRRSIVGSEATRAKPKRTKSRTTIQPDSTTSRVNSHTYNLRGSNRTARRICICENCSGH